MERERQEHLEQADIASNDFDDDEELLEAQLSMLVVEEEIKRLNKVIQDLKGKIAANERRQISFLSSVKAEFDRVFESKDQAVQVDL